MKSITVNGELLPQAEISLRTAQLRMDRETNGRVLDLDERLALRNEALQLLIDRMLILQEACRLSLTPQESEVDAVLSQWAKRFDGVAGCRAGADTPESREDIGRRIMIDKMLNHWRVAARRPRLAELQDYYRMHKQQFYEPETIHASHIACHFEGASSRDQIRDEVENLRSRVAAGEEFDLMAAQHSDCPENDGDLGWFRRGVMVQAFDDVVFATPIGNLTPVFSTEFGFHFALVHARKPSGIRPFEEVRPFIEESLWLAKQDQEVGRALAGLQTKAVIGSTA